MTCSDILIKMNYLLGHQVYVSLPSMYNYQIIVVKLIGIEVGWFRE